MINGNALIFQGTNRRTNSNDLVGWGFAGIQFAANAGAFVINGNSIFLNGSIVNDSTNSQTINLSAITINATREINSNTANIAINSVIQGAGGLAKAGSGTLTLSGNNSYTGPTSLTAGTVVIRNPAALGTSGNVSFTGGGLQFGTGITTDISSRIKNSNSAILVDTNGNNETFSDIIDSSNSGGLTKEGNGTLTLAGSNNFTGGVSLNTGTVVIGHANAAGSGPITQTDGTSLLTFDTTGTIANAMSIYNVSTNKTVTLSGGITVNNAEFDVASGETLTISNTINGTGGVTKNGAGTLVLSGNNTYSAPTVINAGTLEAANANALGSNNTVQVTGGTLLVTADEALAGKNIELSTSTLGLKISGNYSGAIGNLTLSANSSLDLGNGSVQILIQGLALNSYFLSIYNWSGTPLLHGGNGNDTDKVYILPSITPEDLNKISFYSGDYGTDSFLGTGFDLGLQPTNFSSSSGYHIIPVPEPETWATGILLLLGGAIWLLHSKKAV